MTHRQRFQTVLEGGVADRVPMVARLDIWYAARTNADTLPPEVAGLSLDEIQERLQMGRSARFDSFQREVRAGVVESVERVGDRTVRTLELGGRRLREVSVHTAEQRRKGIAGRTAEHYLKDADDYRTMIRGWERTTLVADQAACNAFDRETGPAGLPLLGFGLVPIHRIMLGYAGYGDFYYHQADFPDLVDELRRVMEAKYEEFWPQLGASRAALILHGAHWNTQMTPPRLLAEKFLPYVRRFTDAMHAAGKRCAIHADADLSGLLDLVLEGGIDVLDCFACWPLVPLTLEAARSALGERVVIWGGFPSTLLEPSAGDAAFHDYLDRFVDQIADGRAMIVGVSDNVLPDAIWERIVELARRVADIRPPAARNIRAGS